MIFLLSILTIGLARPLLLIGTFYLQHLWDVYQSAEYAAVRGALTNNPTYIEVGAELDANGVFLTEALDMIKAWFRQ